MNVIRFPKIFNNNSTAIITHSNKAVLQSLYLLMSSEINSLLGDPNFGLRLRKYFFEQNNYILKDILIDEIYTQIHTFLPQIYLERKNIRIIQKNNVLYAQIAFRLKDSFEADMFELVLLNSEEIIT